MGIVYSPMNDYTALSYNCHSLYFPYTAISKETIFYFSLILKRDFYAVYHFKRIVPYRKPNRDRV